LIDEVDMRHLMTDEVDCGVIDEVDMWNSMIDKANIWHIITDEVHCGTF